MTRQLKLLERCYRLAILRARERAGVTLDLLELDELYRLDAALRIKRERRTRNATPTSDCAVAREDDERRTYRRMPARLPATVGDARNCLAATVIDLGAGGVLLESGEPLTIGARVRLCFGRAGATRHVFPCEVTREASHETASDLRYGLRFCGPPLEVRYQSYASREVGAAWLLARGVGNG